MCQQTNRLVEQVLARLASPDRGRDAEWMSKAADELEARVRRLHRLRARYSSVGVSRHIEEMRVVPAIDQTTGASSPRTAIGAPRLCDALTP